MHEVPIDLWHAALLMPIIWTFAAFFYAGIRWERARTPVSGCYTVTISQPPASSEPALAKRPTHHDRPLTWIVRLFLRICRIGRRW